MTFKEIQELIKLVNKSNLTEFKMENGDFKISLRTKNYGKYKGDNTTSILPVQTAMPALQTTHFAPAAPATAPKSAPVEAAVTAKDTTEEDTTTYLEVRSPIVGTFYRSASPDKPPYVKVGDTINVGDVVCIVEAMKLFNEIESEVSGKVVKVLIEDTSPVEYDQVLYLVDPNA